MKINKNNPDCIFDFYSPYLLRPTLDAIGFENPCSNSGLLIWHCLDDSIYLSRGFCQLLGISDTSLIRTELFRDKNFEIRQYLRNILHQVSSSESAVTSFKTRIPGTGKELTGTVLIFDALHLGILDLILICWLE